MPPPTLALGRYQAQLLSAGTFALDGGAMFGIIPKPLWEKKIPADDKNRIPLETRVVLLRDGARTVLVDVGMGRRWAQKQKDIFKIDTHLEQSLAEVGVRPDDVTDVVLTHLHFDHCGGIVDEHGAIAFANARVHVGRRNWQHAHAPNERDRGSYDPSFFGVLEGSGGAPSDRVVLVDDADGKASVLPELDALVCEGHTTGQLLPLIGAADRRALYGADMIPTRAHVPPAWHMGYDLRPLVVLEEKKRLLALCADEGITIIHEHDPVEATSRVARPDFHAF